MSYSIGDGMVSLALAGGIIGYLYVRYLSRQRRMEVIHRERMAAMEKGIPLPELPLDPPHVQRPEDANVLPILGIVLSTLSIGAMIVLYFNLTGGNHIFWISPLPFAFLGIGLLTFHFLKRTS